MINITAFIENRLKLKVTEIKAKLENGQNQIPWVYHYP